MQEQRDAAVGGGYDAAVGGPRHLPVRGGDRDGAEHPDVAPLRALHDEHTRATSGLPLA